MNKPYRFINRKDRKYIQVMFAHIPGKWFSTGTSDFSQAVLWAESHLAEEGIKNDTIAKQLTLYDFAKDFFSESDPHGFRKRNEIRGYKFAPHYYEQKQRLLENYILPAHGSYLLSSITDSMIENLVYNLNSVSTGRELANDTKNKVFDTYGKILEEARRQGLLENNPYDKAERMASFHKRRPAFTSRELERLFPANKEQLIYIWGSLRWAVYFLIQYETGWRPGEVAALDKKNFYPDTRGIYTTSDIDWKNRSIQPRIKTSDKGQTFKAGILSERTAMLLQELINKTRGQYVFIQSNGKFIGPDGANKHLKGACALAGVDIFKDGQRRTQYAFRHSFQSYYLGRIPENARLLLMGHTKMRSEYTHLDANEVLERVSEIEGLNEAIEKRG